MFLQIPKTPNNETFIDHLESVDLTHVNSMSRLNYRLFQIIQQMYNFKIFLQRAHTLGDLNNGRWKGAIGMINRQEVDLCLSGLRWENKHYGAFETTTNTYLTRVKFIFRHPKLIDANTVFTSPFDTIVWISIVLICIASSYFLRHIFAAENHEKVKKSFGNQTINDDTWSNSLLLVFGILFQQGYSNEPLMISSRIVTLTVLIFSVLIFQFYSAFVVGSLLTEAPKTIKTIKQLLHSPLEFGIDDLPYVVDNFEQCSEESTRILYERIIKTKDRSVMQSDEGLKLIKKGGFAFNTGKSKDIVSSQ